MSVAGPRPPRPRPRLAPRPSLPHGPCSRSATTQRGRDRRCRGQDFSVGTSVAISELWPRTWPRPGRDHLGRDRGRPWPPPPVHDLMNFRRAAEIAFRGDVAFDSATRAAGGSRAGRVAPPAAGGGLATSRPPNSRCPWLRVVPVVVAFSPQHCGSDSLSHEPDRHGNDLGHGYRRCSHGPWT